MGGDGLVVVLEVDSDVKYLFYAEMVRLALGFAIVVIVTDERGLVNLDDDRRFRFSAGLPRAISKETGKVVKREMLKLRNSPNKSKIF